MAISAFLGGAAIRFGGWGPNAPAYPDRLFHFTAPTATNHSVLDGAFSVHLVH